MLICNHVSNCDGILVLAYYPRQIEMVGRRLQDGHAQRWLLRAYGVTPVNRGRADSAHFRAWSTTALRA